jgi:hypothetical protein
MVRDILSDGILVTRESAHLLEGPLAALLPAADRGPVDSEAIRVTVDFDGVLGVSPSFVDETVSVYESVVGADESGTKACLVIANPPTRLSSKFEAIARGHAKSIRALPDGSWLLSDAGDAVIE